MEKGRRTESKREEGRRVIKAAIAGTVTFCACILIFPLIMLRTEDPASFVSAACVGTVALTVFFAAASGARGGGVHFVLPALICALVAALLLFGCAFLFGTGEDYGFTVFLAITGLVFSLLGARVGTVERGKRRKRRK